MATEHRRVPQKISDFNAYVNNTSDYLSGTDPGTGTRYVRLGLSDAEFNQWVGFRNQWNPLYSKYSDKKESRTTAIKDKLHKIIKDFTLFSRDILNEIAGIRTSTIDDLEVFHIKAKDLRDTEPSPLHGTEPPAVALKNSGSPFVDFHIRSASDQTRPSMIKGYLVEVRWTSGDPPPNFDAPALRTEVSTRAHFRIDAGAANIGKTFYCYVRWRHRYNPQYNSGWTEVMQLLVI